MKYVTITPVDRPADFKSVRFSEESWTAAKKVGDVKVPYVSARENVRNSGGLYKIKAEKEPVEVKIEGAKNPDEMSNVELAAEMAAFGKPPRKKMNRQTAIDFVRKLREEAAAFITDDDAPEDD